MYINMNVKRVILYCTEGYIGNSTVHYCTERGQGNYTAQNFSVLYWRISRKLYCTEMYCTALKNVKEIILYRTVLYCTDGCQGNYTLQNCTVLENIKEIILY
jgi:hypothetical protein